MSSFLRMMRRINRPEAIPGGKNLPPIRREAHFMIVLNMYGKIFLKNFFKLFLPFPP
jgi:hypothetical protein